MLPKTALQFLCVVLVVSAVIGFPSDVGFAQAEQTENELISSVAWSDDGALVAAAGFSNTLWRSSNCWPNGCSDPGNSGLLRGNWMIESMVAIIARMNWV